MKHFSLLSAFLKFLLVYSLVIFFKPAYGQEKADIWTWVSGDSLDEVPWNDGRTVYGIKGIPSPNNRPGPLDITSAYPTSAYPFVDTAGNCYLLKDPLWRFNPSTNEWTWINGDTTATSAGYSGVFGTQGIPNPSNRPPYLTFNGPIRWTDANNNLWLYGGGYLNDLWKYNISTNQWTWMNGNRRDFMKPVYGTKGVASTANNPGARAGGYGWTDAAGNLWLMGGQGLVRKCCNQFGVAEYGQARDIWKYEIATGIWTWMAGDSSISTNYNMPVVYGTLGVASSTTSPGFIYNTLQPIWTDASGNVGYFNTTNNTFWKFNTTTLQWAWIGGDTTVVNSMGNYGQIGISSPSNFPRTRETCMYWTDAANNFWLYGGTPGGILNDLWKYNFTTKEWVWINGNNNLTLELPYYGIKGSPYTLSYPGSRAYAYSWKGKDGYFWLYGGYYNGIWGYAMQKADLWKMKPGDYNNLSFNMFYDGNYNGTHDTSEPFIRNAIATISSTSVSLTAASQTGVYSAYVDTGTYITTPVLSAPYYTVVPTSHTTSNSTYYNVDSFSFAFQPIPGKRELTISVVPPLFLRSGRNATYTMIYNNSGSDIISTGTIRFVKDSNSTFISSSITPTFINGDTISWNFTNLRPQDERYIYVYVVMGIPPIVNIGYTACTKAMIDPIAGDLDTSNNRFTFCNEVIGAYDPNDKTENHGGKITKTKINSGEYLTYTIRFQNTGNDTAFDVYIRDTLENKLNWSSLQIVASSHKYQMTMNDGKCLFTFPFIMLVDSIRNEPKSHGYIVYKIKAKPNVQIGNVIKNTAAIYFDYNLPIITNTEMTTVVAEALPLHLLSFSAKKEGSTNLLNWATTNEINVNHFDIEKSANGKEFNKIGMVKAGNTGYSFTDNNPLKATNYYRLKMVDKDGQFTYSPIRMINNKGSFAVNVYPNPAKHTLQLQIDSDRKLALQMDIVTQDGKVVVSSNIAVTEGSISRSINIATLPRGTYILRVISEEGEQSAVKFEKL